MKKRILCGLLLIAMLSALLPSAGVFAAPETLLSFNFNDTTNQTAFTSGMVRGGVTFKTGDGTFGIGEGYLCNGNSHTLYPLDEPLDRSKNKNVYLEVEYDMKPLTATGANESLGTVTVVEGTGQTGDAYVHGSGIQFYKKPSSAHDGLWTAFWNPGVHVGEVPFEFEKWYRCKTVIQLNKNGDMTNSNVVDLYIDGEKLATTKIYSAAFAIAENIRLYASSTTYGVDNLTVRKYTADSKPVEKGLLVKKLRDFEAKYTTYKNSAESKEYFDKAAAVYNNANATATDVTAAYGYLETAAAVLFPGIKVAEANFEDGNNTFFTLSGSGTATNEVDTAYYTGKVLKLTLGEGETASKVFEKAVALEKSSENCFIIDMDINSASDVKLGLTEGTVVTIPASDGWARTRVVVDRTTKTYKAFQNGIAVTNGSLGDATAISGITLSSTGAFKVDNVMIFTGATEETVGDKGALIKEMRIANATSFSEDESKIMNDVLEKAAKVYENPSALTTDISKLSKKMAFLNLNLSAKNNGAFKEIFIPGSGIDAENVVLQFNMHNGAQEGEVAYDEIFFNGATKNDFSNVTFSDHTGELQSQVISSGNYDFIADTQMPKNVLVDTLSDGTLVSQSGGMVISKDNAKTWQRVGPHTTGRLAYVDRNDNIYYTLKGSAVTGDEHIGLYQICADENYEISRCVIDLSDMLGQTDAAGNKVTNDTDIIFHAIAEDDDGYIYAGRYCEPWTGSCLYVSREGGQEFRVVDYRPDKQHTHFISVNRFVYPNEVYVTYDDSTNSPLCQVTTDKGGYEEIRKLEEETGTTDFMPPLKATWKKAEGTDGKYGKIVPANEIGQMLLERSKEHFKQIPSPFRNIDYFGHFGLIDETKVDEKGYSDWSNIYAIGMGEANILGGPSVYRTTDPFDPDAYYPVIETAQGARRAIEPVPGIIIAGGLAGGAAHSPQIWISYDKGDTWSAAYTESFALSTGAGNGVGRTYSSRVAKVPYNLQGTADAVNENQVVLCGYGGYAPVRAKFGGDNYFGYSYVQIPYLPAEGMKIFVSVDDNRQITSYTYDIYNDEDVIKSVKHRTGEGDALRFPTEAEIDGEYAVYTFDVDTADNAVVYSDILATDNKNDGTVLSLGFDTENGNIYNEATAETVCSGNEDVKSGKFNVKLIADYKNRIVNIRINDVTVEKTVALTTDYNLPKEFVLGTDDDTDAATVYFSDISFGFTSTSEWIISSMKMTKDGTETNVLSKGTTIESVTVDKGIVADGSPMFFVALYDKNGVLKAVKNQVLSSKGTYDIDLTATDEEMMVRFFLFEDLDDLKPVQFEKLF